MWLDGHDIFITWHFALIIHVSLGNRNNFRGNEETAYGAIERRFAFGKVGMQLAKKERGK